MKVSRRTLFKLLGLSAAGSLLPGCERETHNLVARLIPDEEIVPGVDNWYASVCQECEAGCGILVRTREGRAKKIEGNPDHPVNRGKLCARGQAALQGLYNPDRIQGPLRRVGRRGEGRFEPIGWDEALTTWVERLRERPDGAALISRPLHGTLRELLTRFFVDALGGVAAPHEPRGGGVERAAITAAFGSERLPHYDLARCDYLLSFGAPFLESWLSPVAFGAAFGEMRRGRPGVRGRFVQVEPRLSLTAASADRWIPVKPGTEGLVAVADGRLVLEERPRASRDAALWDSLSPLTLEEISRETDVALEDLRRVARDFARARAPLALGGGMAAAHTNGTGALTLIAGLNRLAGNLNEPGGVQFFDAAAPPGADDPATPQDDCRRLWEVLRELREGARTVLHVYGCNPLHTLPPSSQVAEAFSRPGFVVSFNSFLDESTMMADLVLPDHTPLEAWSDRSHVDLAGPRAALGLGQPVVTPLHQTRHVGDMVLDAAGRLGGEAAERLPWRSFQAMLRERWEGFLAGAAPRTRPVEEEWIRRLQQGGWFGPARSRRPPLPSSWTGYEPPAFDGPPDEYPFYFYPYPSLALGNGQGANRPWLQELPDPLTLVMWGSWVEMNPGTARSLGLARGDVVRVVSPHGAVEAPVLPFPGIRPDLLSMPAGQGHEAYGRYARGRGANPLAVLAPSVDGPTGCLATAGTRVRVEPTGRTGPLVTADQRPDEPVIMIQRRSNGGA